MKFEKHRVLQLTESYDLLDLTREEVELIVEHLGRGDDPLYRAEALAAQVAEVLT